MYVKKNVFRTLLLSGGLLASGAVCSLAQTPTGTISGVVMDSSGAVVPNATVVVTNIATNQSVTRETDDGGRYVAPTLTAGEYTVKVQATGFKPSQQNNVTVDVSETHDANFKLAVGSETQSVTVEATTPQIQTSTATTGQVITGKRILDLPLNGRDPYDLATLVPGVQNTGTGAGSNGTPHIAGSRSANSEVTIDGISNTLPENNVGNSTIGYNPVVDSVSEFNVQTTVLPAEYGRFSGGVINLATKTGANAFHGELFEFNRNSIFDARDYFSPHNQAIPPLSRNQFGGTFGGPLIKNRTFFFMAAEVSRETDSSTETDSVATEQERKGDFSQLLTQVGSNGKPAPIQLYDPHTAHLAKFLGSNGKTITEYVRDPYPGNIIPQSQLSPAGVAALAFQPLPNTNPGSLFNNYVITAGQPVSNYYHFDVRVDHTWMPSWRTFVRFSHAANDNTAFGDYPAHNGVASQGYNGPLHGTAYSLAYDNTITLSPNVLLDLRYGFTRSTVNRTPIGGNFDITQIGLPASLAAISNYPIFPRFGIGNGYSGIGSGGYVPLLQNPYEHDAIGNLIVIKGNHELKFGGEFRKIFLNFHQYGQPNGEYDFSQSWTQKAPGDTKQGGGNPFASLLLGLPDRDYQTNDPSFATASQYYALYAQDTWRATSHFTVSYGLRWDMDQPRTERHNQLSYWTPNEASPIAAQLSASSDCPSCGNLRGAYHYVGTASGQYGRQQITAHKHDFGPRLGVIYSPNANWALRAGFGIVFAPSVMQPAGNSGGAGTDGFSSQSSGTFSYDNQKTINTTLDNPYSGGYILPPGAAGGPGFNLGQGIAPSFITEANTRTPYSEQANATVQRSLPGNTVLEVGWLYNQGKFLVDGDPGTPFDQVNPSYLSLGSALNDNVPNPFYGIIKSPGSPLSQPTIQRNQLLRPFPQYNGVTSYRKDTAYSNYNALTVRLDKRFTKGLTLLVAFTEAKMFDNSASGRAGGSTTYNNQYNPQGEYSLSPQDISHDLVASYTYELPVGPGRRFLSNTHGITALLLGGFQTSGIVNFISGTPLLVGGANNDTNLFTLGQRPIMTASSAKLSHPTRAEWFDTSVFQLLPKYTLGNAPRTLSNVRTPGLVSADLSVIKNNYFGAERRFNVQLRLEGFNAFNHVQLAGPDMNIQDGNFGKITRAANGPRQVQLAAKFIF